jgi:hypothetical protein
LPSWFAVTVTLPVPVIVNMLPDSVAGPLTEKLTGSPELLVAVNVIGATPYVTPGNAPKVMVCDAAVTVSVVEELDAALRLASPA